MTVQKGISFVWVCLHFFLIPGPFFWYSIFEICSGWFKETCEYSKNSLRMSPEEIRLRVVKTALGMVKRACRLSRTACRLRELACKSPSQFAQSDRPCGSWEMICGLPKCSVFQPLAPRGYKIHFLGGTCAVPALESLSQDSIPSSSNTPLTYVNVFTCVCLSAFAAAEVQAKKSTCCGGRSALCFIQNRTPVLKIC